MPIYEYQCRACGHELDALQKVTDRPLKKCPECGKLSLRRLVSAPAFRLKGGGWYETDFKSDGEKKRNLVESSSGESSDAGAEKKAETKPEAAKDGAKDAAPAKDGGAASTAAAPAKSKPATPAPKPAKSRGTRSARN